MNYLSHDGLQSESISSSHVPWEGGIGGATWAGGWGTDFRALSGMDFSYLSLLDQTPENSWPQVNRLLSAQWIYLQGPMSANAAFVSQSKHRRLCSPLLCHKPPHSYGALWVTGHSNCWMWVVWVGPQAIYEKWYPDNIKFIIVFISFYFY